jgi:hypothetical protein
MHVVAQLFNDAQIRAKPLVNFDDYQCFLQPQNSSTDLFQGPADIQSFSKIREFIAHLL